MGQMNCTTMYPCSACMSQSHLNALSGFNTVTGIVNILVNTFLVYGLWKLDLVKTISYKFIFYLCISDCCVGLFTQPSLTVLLLSRPHEGRCPVEITAQSLQTAFCQFSVIMILIITMDRFTHMNYLTRYNSYMTKARAGTLVAINAVTCALIVAMSITSSLQDFYFMMHTATLAINATIIVIIFAVYSKTYFAIRNRVTGFCFDKNNPPVIPAGTIVVTQEPRVSLKTMKSARRRQKHHLHFAKAMIFVLLTLAICYLPYFTVVTMMSYSRYKKEHYANQQTQKVLIFFWSLQLVYINSVLNAAIVILSSKQLRKFMLNFLQRRRPECTANQLNNKANHVPRKRSKSHSF